MIVISGKYKGRKLKTLAGLNTRPTSARTKEDIFNILSNYFIYHDKISFDPFGGSGALSLEGLSRGIKKAYISDHHHGAIKVINENFHHVPPADYEIWELDYLAALEHLQVLGVKVDLVYLDPPFAKTEAYYKLLDFMIKQQLIRRWGCVVIESAKPLDLALIKNQFHLSLLREKKFKTKYFYLLRNEEQN